MPGTGLGSASRFSRSAPRALLAGGAVIAMFTAVVAVAMRGDHSAAFAQPVAVDAVVVEPGLMRSGASRATCSPLYGFDWEGSSRTARPPTRQAASCVDAGRTVRILVDAADPSRVADPAAEAALRTTFQLAAGLAGSMIVLGAILAARRGRRTR